MIIIKRERGKSRLNKKLLSIFINKLFRKVKNKKKFFFHFQTKFFTENNNNNAKKTYTYSHTHTHNVYLIIF